jgi:hypothetical protein
MTVKIALRLNGLDLRAATEYERIPSDLEELSFEANGGVSVAIVYSEESSPTHEAADWAARIVKLVPGVGVTEAFDELVSVSDIAARCDVAAEAVRLWAAGKRRAFVRPFPSPRQVVGAGSGGKTMNLYAWREVLSWVREVIRIDPDEGISYLDDAQYAALNAELCHLSAPGVETDSPWRPMAVHTQVTTEKVGAVVLGRGAMGGLYTPFTDVLEDAGVEAGLGTRSFVTQ